MIKCYSRISDFLLSHDETLLYLVSSSSTCYIVCVLAGAKTEGTTSSSNMSIGSLLAAVGVQVRSRFLTQKLGSRLSFISINVRKKC
jgi:hypothetical protein